MTIEYTVYFLDCDGNPEEWAASSKNLTYALHYLEVYAQDGDVGLFYQEEPKVVILDGKPIKLKHKEY